jgi:hypothetical protein
MIAGLSAVAAKLRGGQDLKETAIAAVATTVLETLGLAS